MNFSELESKISQLLDGNFPAADLAELELELQENVRAREVYRRMARIHSILETRFKARAFVGKEGIVPIERIVARQRRRLFKIALGAAAAIAMLWALLLLQFRAPESPIASFEATPGADFTLTHANHDDSDSIVGQVFAVGSRLVLREGVVEGEFHSGVRMVVEAPCDLRVIEEGRILLEGGVAWFEVPGQAVGFAVETDDFTVVDLGTSFGIYSSKDEGDEVHVTEGAVRVESQFEGGETLTLRVGEARRVDDAGKLHEIPVSSQKFMTTLPLSRGLVARWDFESESNGVTSDSTGNGHSGRLEGGAEIIIDDERGRVLSLSGLGAKADGVDVDSVKEIPNLPLRGGVTLAAWIKRNADGSAGGPHAYVIGLGGSGDNPVATLGVSGAKRFVTGFAEGETGDHNQVGVTGDISVIDGKWTHIAITYDRLKNEAISYVNGKAQRRETDISRVGDGELDWSFGVIGRTPDIGRDPSVIAESSRFFGGLIDDVRIYDRPLKPAEIKGLLR